MKQRSFSPIPSHSAFESRHSPLSDNQKRAYSYLRAPISNKKLQKEGKESRILFRRTTSSSWEAKPRKRRNSVIEIKTNSNKINSVCKEIIDLDLQSSFENLTVKKPDLNPKRNRVQSELLPRPSNPLATLFNRQSETMSPIESMRS